MEENGNGNNGNGAKERLIDLRKVFAIALKNWKVLSRDKIRLIPMFIFPFIMVALFGMTAGTTPKHITAGIVDYDNTAVSRQVADELGANQLFSIGRHVGSQEEGKALIDQGKIKVLFIIPQGFSDDLQGGRSASLGVIIDETDPTVAATTRASMAFFVQALSKSMYQRHVAALAGDAAEISAYLSGAQVALTGATAIDISPNSQAMGAQFKKGMQTGTATQARLESSVEGLKNSLGYMIDQPTVADTASKGYGDASAALALLYVGDQQASVIQQIATFRGLEGANGQMLLSLQGVYQQCRVIEAKEQGSRSAAALASQMVSTANAKAEALEIAAQDTAQNPDTITLNEIQPYGNGLRGLDFMLPNILALISFQGATMGLGRAIAGERKDGSLTRVFLTPTSNVTIIAGTLLFYVLQETMKTFLIVVSAVIFFGVVVKGSMLSVLLIVMLFALGATGVGMVLSVIAKSQEQYMALSMLISLPIMFLSGVITPVDNMPASLQLVAKALPVTYASDGLRAVMIKGFALTQIVPDIAFLLGFGVVTMTLSLLMFKRELI
jgi:ABC transporter DrrB family efflux protein